jgi:hypothetical protein
MIKVYAYKNGDGRQKHGEVLVGSNIQTVLDQATAKLQLRSAARRLYTEDGTLILDVQDLITWSIEHYRRELNKNAAANSDQQKYRSESPDQADEKPFTQPSRKEIKRLLEDFDRNFKVDARRLFRWPVEAWVSCGEPFVNPLLVSRSELHRMSHRELTERAETELEKQKHALRHMAGRRVANVRQFGEVKPEAVYQEQAKEGEVNKLKRYVENIKSEPKEAQPRKKSSDKFTSNSFGTHNVNVSELHFFFL